MSKWKIFEDFFDSKPQLEAKSELKLSLSQLSNQLSKHVDLLILQQNPQDKARPS